MRESHKGGFEAHERAGEQERERIKNTLQRFTPISSDYESALRDMMVDSVLDGEDMRRFFPDEAISDTTEMFLQQVIAAELHIGRTIIEQHTLLRHDLPAFLTQLCDKLTQEEHAILQDGFAGLPHAATTVERLARHLNGEPIPLIGLDQNVNRIVVWKSCNRLTELLCRSDKRMEGILQRLTPQLPAHPRSIVEGLTECLPYLDNELSILAQRRHQRLGDEGFSHLAHSLVTLSFTSPQALIVIAKLNTSLLRNLHKDHPLQQVRSDKRSEIIKRFKAQDNFFETFQRAVPSIYEYSDEALEYILEAIAVRKTSGSTQILLKDTITSHAKAIEAGVFAHELLEKDEATWPFEATRDELRQLVALGRVAIRELLKSHVDYVNYRTHRMLTIMESPRGKKDDDQMPLAGMRGLLRAIRKYDYTTGNALATLATDIVDEFIQKDIIINDWELPVSIGKQIISLRINRNALVSEAQDSKPSPQAIANRMRITLAQVDKLLLEEARLKQRLKGKQEKEYGLSGSTNDFGVNTRFFLRDALKHVSLGYEIIEMRFAKRYPIEEVAEKLEISEADAQQRFEETITVLTNSMEPAKLAEMLEHN